MDWRPGHDSTKMGLAAALHAFTSFKSQDLGRDDEGENMIMKSVSSLSHENSNCNFSIPANTTSPLVFSPNPIKQSDLILNMGALMMMEVASNEAKDDNSFNSENSEDISYCSEALEVKPAPFLPRKCTLSAIYQLSQ
jgi:hypothetical protein